MYSLGEYYTPGETFSLEFKEFFMKISPDVYFTEDEIREIVVNGKWNSKMNNLIIINIRNYINYYLGKYISCFCNTETDGEVIIGVNDDCEITGIPFYGNIDLDTFRDYINTYISENVKGLDSIDRINVNIETVSRDIDFIEDDIYYKLKSMNKKKTKYDKIMKRYISERKAWIREFKYYSRKFSELINDEKLKKRLIKFCIDNNASKKIIDTLKNNEYIDLKYNENFYLRFDDPNDVIHWAGLFKDGCINELKTRRPIRGELPKLVSYNQLLSKICLLRYRFIKNNSNLNYYLIRIKVNGIGSDEVVQYKHPEDDYWMTRSRINLSSGPGCI